MRSGANGPDLDCWRLRTQASAVKVPSFTDDQGDTVDPCGDCGRTLLSTVDGQRSRRAGSSHDGSAADCTRAALQCQPSGRVQLASTLHGSTVHGDGRGDDAHLSLQPLELGTNVRWGASPSGRMAVGPSPSCFHAPKTVHQTHLPADGGRSPSPVLDHGCAGPETHTHGRHFCGQTSEKSPHTWIVWQGRTRSLTGHSLDLRK